MGGGWRQNWSWVLGIYEGVKFEGEDWFEPALNIRNFEVRHPRCVSSNNKKFSVLYLQSNTTIFHLVVQ